MRARDRGVARAEAPKGRAGLDERDGARARERGGDVRRGGGPPGGGPPGGGSATSARARSEDGDGVAAAPEPSPFARSLAVRGSRGGLPARGPAPLRAGRGGGRGEGEGRVGGSRRGIVVVVRGRGEREAPRGRGVAHGALDGDLRGVNDGVVPRQARVVAQEVSRGVVRDARAQGLEARPRVRGEAGDGLRQRSRQLGRGRDHAREAHDRSLPRGRRGGRRRSGRRGGGRRPLLRRHRPPSAASTADARAPEWARTRNDGQFPSSSARNKLTRARGTRNPLIGAAPRGDEGSRGDPRRRRRGRRWRRRRGRRGR